MSGTTNVPSTKWARFPVGWPKESELVVDDQKDSGRFDRDLFYTLIALGAGDRSVPTQGDEAAPAFAAAVYERLVDKPVELDDVRGDNRVIWAGIVTACKEGAERVPEKLRNSLLRIFFPRSHHAPPERPYLMSNFEKWWEGGSFQSERVPDDPMSSVARVRRDIESRGHWAYKQFSDEDRWQIDRIVAFIPKYLIEVTGEVSRRYHW